MKIVIDFFNYCRVVWLANSVVFHHIPLLSPWATGHLCTGQIEASTSPRAFNCASCPCIVALHFGRVGNLNQIYAWFNFSCYHPPPSGSPGDKSSPLVPGVGNCLKRSCPGVRGAGQIENNFLLVL